VRGDRSSRDPEEGCPSTGIEGARERSTLGAHRTRIVPDSASSLSASFTIRFWNPAASATSVVVESGRSVVSKYRMLSERLPVPKTNRMRNARATGFVTSGARDLPDGGVRGQESPNVAKAGSGSRMRTLPSGTWSRVSTGSGVLEVQSWSCRLCVPAHARTASVRDRSRSSRVRLRSRLALNKRPLALIQSSTSPKSRGSRGPNRRLNRQSASGSIAHRSLRSVWPKTPI
jgi:hypothetical protein